ncbi:MAG: hypothetical protein CM1200mP13_07560 [Candidatus Pelagibacterales bacterium]|nr:MAG: hypothetical protein CM1200mP13_07560 [Pelagibacterales bacterium]
MHVVESDNYKSFKKISHESDFIGIDQSDYLIKKAQELFKNTKKHPLK